MLSCRPASWPVDIYGRDSGIILPLPFERPCLHECKDYIASCGIHKNITTKKMPKLPYIQCSTVTRVRQSSSFIIIIIIIQYHALPLIIPYIHCTLS